MAWKRKEGKLMNDIWTDEEIASNWLFLDLNALRKQVEDHGHKWDLDSFIKGMFCSPKFKLPIAYVDKKGNVLFNESARKFERPEEIENILRERWALEGDPIVVLLTREGRELVQCSPDTLVSNISYTLKESEK
jgi:hypothetical protein